MHSKSKIVTASAETPGLVRLSVSKTKTFKECPAKFKFQYIQKLPRKEWAHHVFGNLLHKALELFHLEILRGSTDPFHIIMSECFKKAYEKYKGRISPPQRKEAWDILNMYLKKITVEKSKNILPDVLFVEKEFWILIDNTVLLNGFIDRVQMDPDGVMHVSDYKTTKKKKYLKNDNFQLLTYAFVMCLEDPDIQKIRTSYSLLRHGFEEMGREYTRSEVMEVEALFLAAAEKIKEEQLWRANPTPLCGFCDFLDFCEDGRDRVNYKNLNKFGVQDWT